MSKFADLVRVHEKKWTLMLMNACRMAVVRSTFGRALNFDTAFFCRINVPIFVETFFRFNVPNFACTLFAHLACQFLRILFLDLMRQFSQCFYFADFWHANLRDAQNGMEK